MGDVGGHSAGAVLLEARAEVEEEVRRSLWLQPQTINHLMDSPVARLPHSPVPDRPQMIYFPAAVSGKR